MDIRITMALERIASAIEKSNEMAVRGFDRVQTNHVELVDVLTEVGGLMHKRFEIRLRPPTKRKKRR